jgi:hypothetical protein
MGGLFPPDKRITAGPPRMRKISFLYVLAAIKVWWSTAKSDPQARNDDERR